MPDWIERGHDYFVSTASAAGLLTQIAAAGYTVSKQAVVGFAKWLAITHGDNGIGVSCVCPMGVNTALLRTARESPDTADRLMASAVIRAGEVIEAEDVAHARITPVAPGSVQGDQDGVAGRARGR